MRLPSCLAASGLLSLSLALVVPLGAQNAAAPTTPAAAIAPGAPAAPAAPTPTPASSAAPTSPRRPPADRPAAAPAVELDRVVVEALAVTTLNSIDRKTYFVGQDLQSASGSASDLLQNVPSVQVDIDGNVSLRGNANVLILINGRPSTLLGPNRAMVLEQMPADTIEKIEVITNPSAKYKPDGTAGIINLSLKHQRQAGLSGTVRANLGNDRRGNAGVSANYHPGPYNIYGTVSVRQDDRERTATDVRSHVDPTSGATITTAQQTIEHSRPLSRLVQAGVDYDLNQANQLGADVNYNRRTFDRYATAANLTHDATGRVLNDYDRLRFDPEWETSLEASAKFQHTFPQEGHELKLELKHGRTAEQEDNRYTNVYRAPVTPTAFDNVLIRVTETNLEAIAEYVRPLDADSKLELGYTREKGRNDMDFRGTVLSPATGLWTTDPTVTNRFLYDGTIHSAYATYARTFGPFGALAGARVEQAYIDTNQVTARRTDTNDYFRFYPSLHLTYDLTDADQLQLNYSHRIHRPESDDLNPFPEYQDPFNLHAGNPHLRPEDTHSIETGYQHRRDELTYLATLYFRQTSHGITDVSRYLDATTLLTTKENLATNRSGGLELGATANLAEKLAVNVSGNAFRSEIDARNLGFSDRRATVAWNAKLNATWRATRRDLLQFNTHYTAKRLTAQGYRLPTYVANLGYRHDLADQRTAFVLTLSDLFHTLKERTHLDTASLREDLVRRRSSRLLYLGFIYHFGDVPKKKASDALQFDNQL